MQETVKAGVLYFAIVFAIGFVLGVIRTLFITPNLDALTSVAIELPVMLMACWVVCRRVIARQQVPPLLHLRLRMGIIAFSLLMIAELGLSMLLLGRSMPQHFALYETAPTLLGLIGQIAFALFPVLQMSMEATRSRQT